MKKLILSISVVLVVLFTVTSCKSEAKKETEEVKTEIEKEVKEVKREVEKTMNEGKEMAMATYQCPMKCEGDKTYDKPGQCPVCKMDLKKQEANSDSDEHDHEDGGSNEHEG